LTIYGSAWIVFLRLRTIWFLTATARLRRALSCPWVMH